MYGLIDLNRDPSMGGVRTSTVAHFSSLIIVTYQMNSLSARPCIASYWLLSFTAILKTFSATRIP